MGLHLAATLLSQDRFRGIDAVDDKLTWGPGFSPSNFVSLRVDLTSRECCERVSWGEPWGWMVGTLLEGVADMMSNMMGKYKGEAGETK